MDVGGNERLQLFLLSSDGEMIRPLTDEPEAIHSFGGWSHDGQHIAWTANRRDVGHFDVYIQEVATGEITCVWQTEGMHYVQGWSPDNSQLIVARFHSSFNQDLYLLDVPGGGLRHLTPHEGQVVYGSVVWTPDGGGLYLVSDRAREFLALARLDLNGDRAGGSHAPMSLLLRPLPYRQTARVLLI